MHRRDGRVGGRGHHANNNAFIHQPTGGGGASAALWAAAIQDHVTLMGAAHRGARAANAPNAAHFARQRARWEKARRVNAISVRLPPLEHPSPATTSIAQCTRSGTPDELLNAALPPTLAEKLGIVESDRSRRLSAKEWELVKERFVLRGDRECAICCELLSDGRDEGQTQVLLSCSHSFHLPCLRAFERHTERKRCPLCRTTNYEAIKTSVAKQCRMRHSAIKIQATWRMWVKRKVYLHHRRTVPPKHPLLLQRYQLDRLSEAGDSLQTKAREDTRKINEFLKHVDSQIVESRAILDEAMRYFNGPKWSDVIAILRDRCGESDPLSEACAICLSTLAERKASLLSCSHLFHTKCLSGLEKFTEGAVPKCPCCRAEYHRCHFSNEDYWTYISNNSDDSGSNCDDVPENRHC